VFGNPAAPVTIVEYSDFDCTFCKDLDDTLHQIIAIEGASGKVSWVFRELPLIEIHSNAMKHAEAAECVAQTAGNDAFWKFKKILFANQPADPAQYGTYAKEAGVIGDAFATCFSKAATTVDARILADRQNGIDIIGKDQGVGTPYSLILVAGKAPVVMTGAYPYDAVKELIDKALAN
jgi:protein-disulfide isomerase